MVIAVASDVQRALAPFVELLSEKNERAVEAFVEANLSLLDADLLEAEDRESIGRTIEALDPSPGKRHAKLWNVWIRRWYSEANRERMP